MQITLDEGLGYGGFQPHLVQNRASRVRTFLIGLGSGIAAVSFFALIALASHPRQQENELIGGAPLKGAIATVGGQHLVGWFEQISSWLWPGDAIGYDSAMKKSQSSAQKTKGVEDRDANLNVPMDDNYVKVGHENEDTMHIGGWPEQGFAQIAVVNGSRANVRPTGNPLWWDAERQGEAILHPGDLQDVKVKQVMADPKLDEGGWQGDQLGGVIVDWTDVHRHQHIERLPGGRVESLAAPRIEHRGDGRIVSVNEPPGSSIAFRAPVRSIEMRPCKNHVLEGCELEPPMPSDISDPPPPPPVHMTGNKITAPQDVFTDVDGRKYDRNLYDEAKTMSLESGTINENMVRKLVQHANFPERGDFAFFYRNVFEYVRQHYKLTADAERLVDTIVSAASPSALARNGALLKVPPHS